MDNQWLAAFLGGADMAAKAIALPFQIACQTVIVESGLANGHNFRVCCQR